ncbi:major histocompatibility complex class I-related gene protein-like [Corythoichthys intestinalis]|uniref:major histocompatibility complex class I-related gene protein-like n=1 Tax=Corythoichthys intestinalis TaxID=161448 RepID=UPI0025A5311A|nr:major histocompatibility complex class I-related gene protein-like [Corythoichthys intestinalis]
MVKIFALTAFLLAQIDGAAPVIHSLKYIATASFQIPNFPEYMEVGYVDGIQILHYDSETRTSKAKQDWMNNMTIQEPYFWERQTIINTDNQQDAKVGIRHLQEHFNQTGGRHLIQRVSGCQWDNETGQIEGWLHDAYNGEDFLWFDLKELRWIAVQPRAVISKHELDTLNNYNEYLKESVTKECPFYLKKYVSLGRDVLMRTEVPRVSLLQKTAGSLVTCHATGFYPRAAVLFWRKDGERLYRDAEMDEILPNHDGTFQTSASLHMSDKRANYECVFHMEGVPEDVVTPLDLAEVLSNERIQEKEWRRKMVFSITLLIPIVLAVAVAVGVGVILFKHKRVQYTPARK